MKPRIIIHGEVNFIEQTKDLKNLKKLDIQNDYYVVGESEIHGNDHRVAVKENVQLFTNDSNELFLINKVGTNVYCPNEGRHDSETIPTGIWKIVRGREYDYFEESHRLIAD